MLLCGSMCTSTEGHTHRGINLSTRALCVPQMCPTAVRSLQPLAPFSHSYFLLPRSFSVRYATAADVQGVENLTSGLEGQEWLLCDLNKYLQASRDPIVEGACPLCVVVGVCAEQVVGVAILRTEEV